MQLRLASETEAPPGPAGCTQRRSPIVGGGRNVKYRFTVLADGLLRYEWAPDSQFEDRPSVFAVRRDKCPTPEFGVAETDNTLEIVTARFRLTYDRQEFSPGGLFAVVKNHTQKTWRYGEPPSPGENLGGTARTLDDADGPVDMGLGVASRRGHASIDDSHTMVLDGEGRPAARRPGPGRVDGYLFAYGSDYRAAVRALYAVSGPPPLLPRWALGNWWSRYYPYTADQYLALVDRFRGEGIPLSVAVLDMDWHIAGEDPRVRRSGASGWTGYTWNRELIPDPPAFLGALHERGLKTTLNEHPADGVYPFEDLYDEFAEAVGRDPSDKEPIPFDAADRRYLQAYFDVLISSLEKDGMDFVWIDWQQGPYSRLRGVDPLWVLNHFHYLHNAQSAAHKGQQQQQQPLILSRYAGPGSHRYPVGFSGDTRVTWASLAFQPEFTATAANVGYGWWSHDVGGHIHGAKDAALLVRWVQLGVFSPVMRLHSTRSQWVAKEPWRLPRDAGAAVAGFMRLRHRLLPYLYAMNVRASTARGEPLVQPMYWECPGREEAYRYRQQYLFGSEMVVVPITSPQAPRVGLGRARGWLPPGKYVDFFTGVAYQGGRELWFSRTLETYPVLLRQGSIVPLDRSETPEFGAENPDGLEVVVVVGADGSFDLVEDDDETGARMTTTMYLEQATGIIRILPTQGVSQGSRASRIKRHWALRLIGFEGRSEPVRIAVGWAQPTNVQPSQVANGLVIDIGYKLPEDSVVVFMGEDPQLAPNNAVSLIREIVDRAEVEYDLKDAIWKLFEKPGTARSTQISGLEAIDMTSELRVAILECLLADACD